MGSQALEVDEILQFVISKESEDKILSSLSLSAGNIHSSEIPRSDVLIEVWGNAEDMLPPVEPVYSDAGGDFGPITLAPTSAQSGYLVRALERERGSDSSDASYVLLEEQEQIEVLSNHNTIIQFGGTW